MIIQFLNEYVVRSRWPNSEGSVAFLAPSTKSCDSPHGYNNRRNSGALEYPYESRLARQWHKREKGRIVMRKHSLMLAAATIGLAASQASAADLPTRTPAYVPPAPPQVTWTGCYIGANIGGIFGHGEADFALADVSRDNGGFAGGGQIGCDY